MERKINNVLLILGILLLAAGCANAKFDDVEDPNVFYQIYPGQENILRLRRTIDGGAPLIQLFDGKGNQLEEIIVAPMGIFYITLIKNYNVQITYLIGQSDLEMFLPWLKKIGQTQIVLVTILFITTTKYTIHT